ncbi:MAG TPA: hypothetical protein PLY34_16420 [Ferruginibacter sp.]|nr:hypothetical protein [Ferruginibacter sp.]HPH92968.1 hypothetical protein [Ferruginibacter sp.]
MKHTFLFLLVALIFSCNNNEAFINHKLTFEKMGDCSPGEKAGSMLSNIAGERYVFESCLDAAFDGTQYSVDRVGDSLVVSFPKTDGPKNAFNITLDIDAFPVYNFIVLDGKEAIPIRHVEK